MSRKLHEEALEIATLAAETHVYEEEGPWPRAMMGDEVLVRVYLAHCAAHGVKLTPREPTDDMHSAGNATAFPWTEPYQALWDAAPSWPGDAE